MATLPPEPIAQCKVCGWPAHMDDWAVQPHGRRGVVVCVGCFARVSNDERHTDKSLIREVEDAEGKDADGL